MQKTLKNNPLNTKNFGMYIFQNFGFIPKFWFLNAYQNFGIHTKILGIVPK